MTGFQTSMSVRTTQGIWKHANTFLGVIFTVSEFLSLGRALGPCNFLRLPGNSTAVWSYSEKNYCGIISIWQWRKMLAAVQQLVWWPSYHHISEIKKVSKHLLFHHATPLLKNMQWLLLSFSRSSLNFSLGVPPAGDGLFHLCCLVLCLCCIPSLH